jgi:L-threonylcarbamoyladenylate synthase
MAHTPVLACDITGLAISPSATGHPLQSPTLTIPPPLQASLDTAAAHLRAGRTVAFPTETVYGLGAHSLDPSAVAKVYAIKRRPSDNPLIIHVSSLDMLARLLPANYSLSPLYLALIDAFWPGPLTLLFPSPSPAPLPAHPLARALIAVTDLPVSAPSANSSGRPSPTQAAHVAHDLDGADGLGCILDGGACGVGVESTVVDGLGWLGGGGGAVNVLRPGGLGVEEIARVVAVVDAQHGGSTRVLLHGKQWSAGGVSATKAADKIKSDAPPSTPGMKYRHYSPRIPVHLLLPSNIFAQPPVTPPATLPVEVVSRLAAATGKDRPRLGFLHFDNSPLFKALAGHESIVPMSLGPDATSAAQRLFSGMLSLEADGTDAGVDAILIEGCSDDGLGLAVMERVGKAVGGGGVSGALGNGQVSGPSEEGRYWVQV